mgnify:CR=1 FL=1|jgi:hypothetical protein
MDPSACAQEDSMIFRMIFFSVATAVSLVLGFGVLSGIPALLLRVLSLYLLIAVVIGLIASTVKPRL